MFERTRGVSRASTLVFIWLRSHRSSVPPANGCGPNEVNLTGTINIFDQARRLRQRREIPVVYASTAAIYADCGAPISEGGPIAPVSAYGADKHACELHARVASAVHGIPTVGLRFFNLYGPNLYGPRQDPQSPYSGVIARFADRLVHGEPVEIFGDGQQIRDFTFVDDAVVAQRPARSGEVRMSIGDPRHAAERLGFRAETTLAEGLAITLDLVPTRADYTPRAVA